MHGYPTFRQFYDALHLETSSDVRIIAGVVAGVAFGAATIVAARLIIHPSSAARVVDLGDGRFRLAPQLPIIDVEAN